ncbi:MAG: hypothetical protein ACLR8Y_13035 [Alistipes indistinctus]
MLLPVMLGRIRWSISTKPRPLRYCSPCFKKVRPTIMLTVPLDYRENLQKQNLTAGSRQPADGGTLQNRIGDAGSLHTGLPAGALHSCSAAVSASSVSAGRNSIRTVELFLLEGRFPYAIGYGLTETAPVLAGVNPSMGRWHQSTGPMLEGSKPVSDITVNPRSGEGEIVVKGPNRDRWGITKIPKRRPTRLPRTVSVSHKRLQGCLDGTVTLYIKGRLTNMILGPSGENIYPEEIENVINGHALVADSLVKEDMGKLVAIVHFNREALEQKNTLTVRAKPRAKSGKHQAVI